MNCTVYDGSFDGLLAVVFDAYLSQQFPDSLVRDGDVLPLWAGEPHKAISSQEKSNRVLAGLERRLPQYGLHSIMMVWLSEEEGSDFLLFKYLCKIFNSRHSIDRNMADPTVFAVEQLARKVRGERHRMLGFVRFQETVESVYFATLEPRYDVLPLLLRHFADRLSDQKWILYDAGREYGFFYDLHSFKDVRLSRGFLRNGSLESGLLSADELMLGRAWQEYCKALSIKERYNSKLQVRCMPKRYWKYMLETNKAPYGEERIPCP